MQICLTVTSTLTENLTIALNSSERKNIGLKRKIYKRKLFII